MADLKPCPFCGGEARAETRQPGGTGASGMEPYLQRIACPRCRIALPWEHPVDEWGKQAKHNAALAEKQAAIWNTRAAERAGGGMVVDDAMVERAYVAYAKDPPGSEGMVPEERRAAKMRAALIAALVAHVAEVPVAEAQGLRTARRWPQLLDIWRVGDDENMLGVWFRSRPTQDQIRAVRDALRADGDQS